MAVIQLPENVDMARDSNAAEGRKVNAPGFEGVFKISCLTSKPRNSVTGACGH
jgi:hypothetical protein